MTDRELMQQALDYIIETNRSSSFQLVPASRLNQVITALRERLAQPNEFSPDWDAMAVMVAEQQRMATEIERLKDGFNEPVAWVCYGSASDEKHTIDYRQEDIDAIPVGTMLYTAPRQWQRLTEQEIKDCEKQAMVNGALPFEQRSFFARAIEAKLREKNA